MNKDTQDRDGSRAPFPEPLDLGTRGPSGIWERRTKHWVELPQGTPAHTPAEAGQGPRCRPTHVWWLGQKNKGKILPKHTHTSTNDLPAFSAKTAGVRDAFKILIHPWRHINSVQGGQEGHSGNKQSFVLERKRIQRKCRGYPGSQLHCEHRKGLTLQAQASENAADRHVQRDSSRGKHASALLPSADWDMGQLLAS